MVTYRAAAPEMISISSLVMTAWRVRLNVKVNLSIISATNKTKQKIRQQDLKLEKNTFFTNSFIDVCCLIQK